MNRIEPDTTALKSEILDRFVRYAKINTTSNDRIDAVPSTPGQRDLLKLLKAELEALGITETTLTEQGYLVGRIPSNTPHLASYKGDTIVTSDGTTLLGADDKAGIAVIMTAAAWLMKHPEHSRPYMLKWAARHLGIRKVNI